MEVKTNHTKYAEYKKKKVELVGLMNETTDIISELNMKQQKSALERLSAKIESDSFKIQIVGTFKNGKSTFINSFLGEEILPAYSLPCTAVINEVKWGKEKKAIIHFKQPLPEKLPESTPDKAVEHIKKHDSAAVPPLEIPYDEIEDYAVIPFDADAEPSEMIMESPYMKIELFWPLPLLENGIEIIDSPGLNEHSTRTKVTMDYLNKADAIIFVLNAQQICTKEEMNFIVNDLKGQGFTDPFFVVNRFDCISSEKERMLMKEFVHTKLSEYTTNDIFYVSALNALDGKIENDTEKYERSGMKEFEGRLSYFLTREKGRAKLSQPARELKRIMTDEALFSVIPGQRKLLNSSLDEVKERYEQAKPQLDNLKRRKDQVGSKLKLNVDSCKPEFKRAIAKSYTSLIDSIPAWVEQVEVKTELGFIPNEQKTKLAIKEITEAVGAKIVEQQVDWKDNVLEPLVNERMNEMIESVKSDIEAFYERMDTVNLDLSGNTYKADDADTWKRVVGIAFAGSEDSENTSSETGLAQAGNDKLKSFALRAGTGVLLASLIPVNQVIIFAGIIAAFVLAIKNGPGNAVKKLKASVSEEMISCISKISSENSESVAQSIYEKFKEISDRVTDTLDAEIEETENQINGIIEEMEKGKENIALKNEAIDKCEDSIKGMSTRLDSFIFRLVE